MRECQEKALQGLQAYTLAHYPDTPSKFGELLLRIPDLQRTCQVSGPLNIMYYINYMQYILILSPSLYLGSWARKC